MASAKAKFALLFLGDIASFYAALFLMLAIRYQARFDEALPGHLPAFSALIVFWLAAFYAAGLYDWKNLKNVASFFRPLVTAFAAAFFIALAFFYLAPVGIRPRGNLILFAAVFLVCFGSWRYYFNRIIRAGASRAVVLLGDTQEAREIAACLRDNPQFGYRILDRLDHPARGAAPVTIVVPTTMQEPDVPPGAEVRTLASFYEDILDKMPISEVAHVGALQERVVRQRGYEFGIRLVEFIFAAVGLLLFLPLFAVIALLVRTDSSGPVFYSQTRTGRNSRPFTLYKFRSMYTDAEKHGPRWAAADDPRCTRIGAWLRRTHLDELPQLFNILKGDLALVGPRPERPEFVRELAAQVPHYEARHIIRPGLTGWAQINYRYGASVADAREKLQYDLYYIKRRSLALDLLIALKTAKLLFTTP